MIRYIIEDKIPLALKCERPIGFKDKNPWKRRTHSNNLVKNDNTNENLFPEEMQVFDIDKNEKILLSYVRWNWNAIVIDQNLPRIWHHM